MIGDIEELLYQYEGKPSSEIRASIRIDPSAKSPKDWPQFRGHYINSTALPGGLGMFPDDPVDAVFEPFPEIEIKKFEVPPASVGVQLHCGATGHNFRGFSVGWVRSTAQMLTRAGAVVHLLGTGEGYKPAEIATLDSLPHVVSWLGRTTFKEWLSLIDGMDALISLEGFPAFFALARQVPTALYNQYPFFVTDDALHSDWQQHVRITDVSRGTLSTAIREKTRRVITLRNLYAPVDQEALINFVQHSLVERNK